MTVQDVLNVMFDKDVIQIRDVSLEDEDEDVAILYFNRKEYLYDKSIKCKNVIKMSPGSFIVTNTYTDEQRNELGIMLWVY